MYLKQTGKGSPIVQHLSRTSNEFLYGRASAAIMKSMNEAQALPLIEANTPPPRTPLLNMSLAELREWMIAHGQPPMRAKQIRKWIFANRATNFAQMSDLPKLLRPELEEAFSLFSSEVEKHLVARDDTNKLLLKLPDQSRIECVLIQDDDRHTACISTQVGCGMGCVFCASGMNGVVRNLTVGEILEQVVLLRNLTPADRRLTHIVVMGMGEPLANLENLLEALAIVGDADGLNIGQRHITISTVGLPAKIRKLAEHGKQYHLAVSLHASNDELRNKIVPTNTNTGIAAILKSADEFFETTGRQVTFEYVVLGGLNDQPEHARELVGWLRGRKSHVNLIPWNSVEGMPYDRPTEDDLNGFIDYLRRHGVSVTVRQRRGAEIDAACGQLRRSVEQSNVRS